ncbi:hypothetical protein RLEG3_19210 [Rhizobium leguminosarum bv. trifolii WSM1689]|nr:hypothetical protein RLEG3_19210 [Rhizobium leguminosarum bv. trifolii WSM1689]
MIDDASLLLFCGGSDAGNVSDRCGRRNKASLARRRWNQ